MGESEVRYVDLREEEAHARGAAVNAELRAAGRCWAHNDDINIPAAYIWYTEIGNEVPLCVECCAAWRALPDGDPPVRIESLDTGYADHDVEEWKP